MNTISQSIQTNWWVSVSAQDAALAARQGQFSEEHLELAEDRDNHPQCIDLPGGPHLGLRPLQPLPSTIPDSIEAQVATLAAFDDGSTQPAVNQDFTGGTDQRPASARKRLPHPLLSYARLVSIPKLGKGQIAQCTYLILDKARYHVRVSIDQKPVTQYVGGLEPHRIDISDYVKPGQTHLVVITVGDTGVSGHRLFDPYRYTGNRLPTCKEIENNLVHPVIYGGADRAVGYVTLEAVPALRVDHVFANPKVKQGQLHYQINLVNDTNQQQVVHVSSTAEYIHDGIALPNQSIAPKKLVSTTLTLSPHSTHSIREVVPWADALLWDTDHPHRYTLRTVLKSEDGQTIWHEHVDAFGFREFEIRGHSFYLNGQKIHLHGSSGHVGVKQDAMSLSEKIAFLKAWKEQGHVNHVRIHAKPWDKGWVEAADRVGMLITTETALWTTGFHSFDWAGSEQACYENVRNHFFEALVRRDRNNPSVVIWSLSNEMSPITPWDLANPKMAAMTRVFTRILKEAEAEDDSRVIQMSSAMDFLGHLKMYNLHYPKSWQAFPDHPHTSYWLDSSYHFRWFGLGYEHVPSWGWRKDKPLYFGEFVCVYGPTPDTQAAIVGDEAFEHPDFGSHLVNHKLWPMEICAYRRLDVSGFCAWAAMFHSDYTEAAPFLREHIEVRSHTHALRPLALLNHSYRSDWFSGDEVAIQLSMHNDTRDAHVLEASCDMLDGDRVIWSQPMPAAAFGPAENKAFTFRWRAPKSDASHTYHFRAALKSDGKTVDQWSQAIPVHAVPADWQLPASCGLVDPSGELAELFKSRGISGGSFLRDLHDQTDLSTYQTLWLNFQEGKLHRGDWRRMQQAVNRFVTAGGCVILEHATQAQLELPVPIQSFKGFAQGQLELTYAYVAAPHHPIMRGLHDEHVRLWGEDYYIAKRCVEVPMQGNVRALLVAGADRVGLIASPLLEVRQGRGSYLVSHLELFGKLRQSPHPAQLIRRLSQYMPEPLHDSFALHARESALTRLREVGLESPVSSIAQALQHPLVYLDVEALSEVELNQLQTALNIGSTVTIHGLSVAATMQLLTQLQLPGQVSPGQLPAGQWDVIRHTHPLVDGITSNQLYWIVDKAKIAPWTAARLHPEPATAHIQLPSDLASPPCAWSLTKFGALTVYHVGKGTLLLDHLRWEDDRIDEPERTRRLLTTLLTNLHVPLTRGVAARLSHEYETAEERRERGHF